MLTLLDVVLPLSTPNRLSSVRLLLLPQDLAAYAFFLGGGVSLNKNYPERSMDPCIGFSSFVRY